MMNALILLLAVPVAFALICRLSDINFARHRASVVMFHALQLMHAGYAAWAASTGIASGGELLGLLASGCWLVMSWPTWSEGPPEHVKKARIA
jgi:hypothetical protein